MAVRREVIGERFGKWIIVRENGRDKKSCQLYECKCDCGFLKNQTYANLKNGITTQCKSCCMKERNIVKDLIGEVFGALTVIEKIKIEHRNEWQWKCICLCGNNKIISSSHLKLASKTLNHRCSRAFHGMSNSSTYKIWNGMHNRCYKPNTISYKYYGARGITICERWMVFENFLVDMGERPVGLSIDRIDNNGNYEPSNCRWATSKDQSLNTRRNKKKGLNNVISSDRTSIL